ncbi:MAG: DUF697 domain-containing protein [Magnetococcales bacterium]|nr:DUF697 domain-containing protein [Magnetococcales bacterium]
MTPSKNWAAPLELPVTAEPDQPKESPVAPVELPFNPDSDQVHLEREQEIPDSHHQSHSGVRIKRLFRNRALFWLFVGGLSWLAGIWIEDIYYFLWRQFQVHWALGSIFSLLTAATILSAVVLLAGEMGGLTRLKRFDVMRHDIQDLWHGSGHGAGAKLTVRLRRGVTQEEWLEPAWRQFHHLAQSHHSDRELLELLSRTVYAQLDQRCYHLIVQRGTMTAMASTIIPFVWLDSLIFLWQNLRLIREIAQCYGLKPGWSGNLFLARDVLLGLFMAGTADLMVDKVAEAVGGHAASRVLAQLGKGAANALFTARIGMAAMNRCRTLPFHPGGEPSLERLRVKLIETIKRSLEQEGGKPIALP